MSVFGSIVLLAWIVVAALLLFATSGNEYDDEFRVARFFVFSAWPLVLLYILAEMARLSVLIFVDDVMKVGRPKP